MAETDTPATIQELEEQRRSIQHEKREVLEDIQRLSAAEQRGNAILRGEEE